VAPAGYNAIRTAATAVACVIIVITGGGQVVEHVRFGY